MNQGRPRSKKEPRHLEDITFSIAPQAIDLEENLFSSKLFMGRYDEQQLIAMLDRVGIISILHRRGYRNLVLSIHRQDDYTSRLYVNFDSLEKETRLIEVIVREGVFRPKENFMASYDFSDGLSMLLIEWLALQDPRAQFSPDKPRLPGQQYPGLGGLKNMQEFLYGLGQSAGKVDSEVNRAVTALQFQDLVSQLINHVGRRVEALRGSAQAIEGLRKVLEMNPDDPAAIHRVRDELVRLGEHLDTHEVSGKHNPVAQHALSHGDIELF